MKLAEALKMGGREEEGGIFNILYEGIYCYERTTQYNISFLANYSNAGNPQIVITKRLQWVVPIREARDILEFSLIKAVE